MNLDLPPRLIEFLIYIAIALIILFIYGNKPKSKSKSEIQLDKDNGSTNTDTDIETRQKDDIHVNDPREKLSLLSKKYSVLNTFQVLCYLNMIISTGWFIYYLITLKDTLDDMSEHGFDIPMDGYAILASVIMYIMIMFSLFCTIKIIDFLFDLDLYKPDK